MVEIIGVIAIVGVLSVGGIVGFRMAMEKYKSSVTTDAITLLSQQVRSFYLPIGKYNGLGVWTSDGSNGSKTSPAAIIIEGADISIPYPLTIAEQSSTGNSGFAIGVTGISVSVCIDLHNKNWKNANNDFDGVGLPGTGDYKPTMTEVIEGCEAVEKDKDRSFIMYFKPMSS